MPPTQMGPPTGAALSLARRKSSVEFVRAQYQKLLTQLGTEDRMKVSLHRDMLEDLALRVAALQQITCTKPTTPPKGNEDNMQVAEILMTKMFPTAMACDLTRVGELYHTSPS